MQLIREPGMGVDVPFVVLGVGRIVDRGPVALRSGGVTTVPGGVFVGRLPGLPCGRRRLAVLTAPLLYSVMVCLRTPLSLCMPLGNLQVTSVLSVVRDRSGCLMF